MQSIILKVLDLDAYLTRSVPPLLVVHAQGEVTTSGWSDGALVPWSYLVEPQDGILDFNFVATAPVGGVLQVITPVYASFNMVWPKWCRGVRVHASTGKAIEKGIFASSSPHAVKEAEVAREGDTFIPVPWLVSKRQGSVS